MATEQVVEGVAEGLEVAAEHLEEAAIVTRRINPQMLGYTAIGLGVGLAVGFFIGYRWNRAKIRAEAFKQSEKEVEQIREMYQNATKLASTKPSLEEVVEERRYSHTDQEVDHEERPTRPPVPVAPALRTPEQDAEVPVIKLDTSKSRNIGWDYSEEVANRSPDRPYIIHQDEYSENATEYKQSVLTWYVGDDVLTDEDEQIMDSPDDIVGLDNMSKFGHGTDDFNVVFIRNESIQMEYEVCRMPESYAEAVQGLHDDEPH